MQPPVVKYQARKQTQVTKNKFCKIYSDIKKNGDNLNKIPRFFHENVFFSNSRICHAWDVLGQCQVSIYQIRRLEFIDLHIH